jgi:Fe-Mn family superoxide dismutase
VRPGGGDAPEGRIKSALDRNFGGERQFRAALAKVATGRSGSGWAWLVARASGRLEVAATCNADTPLAWGKVPLLAIDVWEHAYDLDYENCRADDVAARLDNLVDWRFAEENLATVQND